MKRLLLLAMPVMALLFAVACDNDKNDGDNGTITTGKLIKTAAAYYSDGTLNVKVTITYDNQGRPVMLDYGDEGTRHLSYSDNLITIIDEDKEVKITLNNNGYATTHTARWHSGEVTARTITYENNYLAKIAGEYSETTYTFKWENGNLATQTRIEQDNDESTWNYEYNNVENTLNLDPIELLLDYSVFHSTDGDPYTLKLKGCASKNYVISDEDTKYEYTFDKDGYPTQIIVTWDDDDYDKILITYY